MSTMGTNKITTDHLRRIAYVYIRQSTIHQMRENKESTARQYDLKDRALALGWNHDQIIVIDEDLGISGASACNRSGFQRLVAEVGLGRVGIVMGLEVSRLARSSTDWHRLLEICALSDTLILDEDGLYDPSHFNDRLLLGLKGTMSEAELHVLKARLLGGLMNKARRGELWMRAPIGYINNKQEQRLVLDPDEQIQGAVRLLFETFHREGSAEAVVRHFRTQGILFPRRIKTGPRAGEVIFVPMEHSRVLNMLHNPRFAGAYVFGRTRQRKGPGINTTRTKRLARQDWKVFLPNIHAGYISWEKYEANQEKLLDNANGYGPDRKKSPPREGAALLQGLAICGVCGKRMTIRYDLSQGRLAPVYVCQRQGIETAGPHCQSIAGAGLDEAVGKTILDSVTPASLEVALEVFEEFKARRQEADRLRRAQVERAREESELAQRQYMMVRPENRLVADALERQWNEKLLRLRQAQEEYERAAKSHGGDITPEQKEQILALASDLPRVWNNPHTPMRDKKRMLRLLVDDITLTRSQAIRIQIRWKGGKTTSLEVPLPKSMWELRRTPTVIVEQIRALAAEKTDGQIAKKLNDQRLHSGTGKPFKRLMVRSIRLAYGIKSLAERFREAGWFTREEIASQFGICPPTVTRLAKEGIVRAVRSDDKGQILIEPIIGPLPKIYRGMRHRNLLPKYPGIPLKVRNEVQYAA